MIIVNLLHTYQKRIPENHYFGRSFIRVCCTSMLLFFVLGLHGSLTTQAQSSGQNEDLSVTYFPLISWQIQSATASGLQFIVLESGSGPQPATGQIVYVHYTAKLQDGTPFDDTLGRDPFGFQLGAGQVIQGFEEGVALLSEGAKATLIIPPDLGYGANGVANIIPPDATIIFTVEVVQISDTSPAEPIEVDDADYTETDSGLKYYDFEIGEGDTPEEGNEISVHYTGWLMDGTKFDSSIDRFSPFNFTFGTGQVIEGFDEGLSTMQVGGKRQLLLPSELAYGEAGAGNIIPPNSILIFEVELVSINAE